MEQGGEREMKTTRARYQQGSIKRVPRTQWYAWEVRSSEWKDGKRCQRCLTYDGLEYPTEKDVRKAIEGTVSQLNSDTAGERVNALFGVITALYRKEYLPTEEVVKLKEPPVLQHSTRKLQDHLLTRYIEPELNRVPLRDVKPLLILEWFRTLKLAPTTKAQIIALDNLVELEYTSRLSNGERQ